MPRSVVRHTARPHTVPSTNGVTHTVPSIKSVTGAAQLGDFRPPHLRPGLGAQRLPYLQQDEGLLANQRSETNYELMYNRYMPRRRCCSLMKNL